MTNSMIGLRVKPTYEQLIGVAVSDKLENIKFPNRSAKFLREGFILSQLDSEGMAQMEKQQEMASKEAFKEHLLKEIAKNTGANIHDLRNKHETEMRTERTTNAVYFDISHGDDMDVSLTNEAEVQTKVESSSSGVQAKAESSSSGVQTKPTLNRSNTKGTQATEDKSEEIAKIQRASELEKEALKEQHNKNIEQVRQQVRQQVTAEAESAHETKRQGYHQEAVEKIHITEAEAQRKIHQINQTAQQRAQESVRQEAQSYVGNVIRFAENQHQSEMGAAKAAKAQAEKEAKAEVAKAKKEAKEAKEHAEKEAKAAAAQAKKEAAAEVAKAKKEAKEAKEQAKRAAQSEHNTDFRAAPSTPDRKANAKAKTGPSPKKPPPVPEFPTGEQATGSQERPRYTVHPNDNVNPESERPPKGRPGRPPNTSNPNVRKDHTKNPTPTPKTKAKAKANPTPTPTPKAKAKAYTRKPKHDTDLINDVDLDYWQNVANLTTMRDQLNKRGFRKYKTPNGKAMNKPHYLEEILKRINEGRWII